MKPLIFILKLYVIAALLYAAILSPSDFSVIPIFLLALYLFQWRRAFSQVIDVLTQYFLFFAIALLYSVIIPEYYAPLVSLPILLLINQSLTKYAHAIKSYRSHSKRHPTPLFIVLSAIALSVLALSLLLSDLTLILSVSIIIIYLICLTTIIISKFSGKPVKEEQIELRILAGNTEEVKIVLNPLSGFGMTLFFESDFDWIKIMTKRLHLKNEQSSIQLTITPVLSGPSVIKFKVYAIDRWGLFQVYFEIEPLKLIVIPRARYASWLAQKYMAGTRQGTLPLISNSVVTKVLQGYRQGVEYYGNRIYQAGDSLKHINWKASAKYDELISKEFDEFRGQPAVILINLLAGSDDELDKLAHNILITAISLGQANIPASLAVYDEENVVMTTPLLSPLQLVSHSLRIVKKLTIHPILLKYSNPPDVLRLRANIGRLSNVDSYPSRKLSELLRMEYEVLNSGANSNPCTQALFKAKAKINEQFNIVVLSLYNHDAEALVFNTYTITRNGSSAIIIK